MKYVSPSEYLSAEASAVNVAWKGSEKYSCDHCSVDRTDFPDFAWIETGKSMAAANTGSISFISFMSGFKILPFVRMSRVPKRLSVTRVGSRSFPERFSPEEIMNGFCKINQFSGKIRELLHFSCIAFGFFVFLSAQAVKLHLLSHPLDFFLSNRCRNTEFICKFATDLEKHFIQY